MPDQEFLASYAVEIDEAGVARLQSILEADRSLAEALSAAFQQAWADLDAYVSYAAASAAPAQLPPAAGSAAASGAVPSASGFPDFFLTFPAESREAERDPAEISSFLSDMSASLSRLVSLSSGPDNISESSASGRSAPAAPGLSADSEVHLDLSGAGEELQSFLQDLAVSDAEIPAALDLSEASETLSDFQASVTEAETALPLRLDRTRAELSLSELQRMLRQPLSLTADTSAVISAASSALSSIRAAFSSSPLQLNASILPAAVSGLPDAAAAADSLSGLAAYLDSASSAASAAAPAPSVSRSVEAPVNITVNASGTDSQALGQSIYNSAQRYLVKTLRQTMQ